MKFWSGFKSLPWIQIVTIIISLIALFVSIEAINQAKKANDMSEKAILESQKQFSTLNRPVLNIKAV